MHLLADIFFFFKLFTNFLLYIDFCCWPSHLCSYVIHILYAVKRAEVFGLLGVAYSLTQVFVIL